MKYIKSSCDTYLLRRSPRMTVNHQIQLISDICYDQQCLVYIIVIQCCPLFHYDRRIIKKKVNKNWNDYNRIQLIELNGTVPIVSNKSK